MKNETSTERTVEYMNKKKKNGMPSIKRLKLCSFVCILRTPAVAVTYIERSSHVFSLFQISTSLPRQKKLVSASTPNLSAVTTPNLTSASVSTASIEKPEKQHKHKFGFHLPKVFKKSRLGRQKSLDSAQSDALAITQPMSDEDDIAEVSSNIAEQPTQQEIASINAEVSPGLSHKSPEGATDIGVVPIDEKIETVNQERANDAATEEAVVPFADKGLLFSVSGWYMLCLLRSACPLNGS